MRSIFPYLLLCAGVVACSPGRRLTTAPSALPIDTVAAISTAQQVLVNDTALAGAHLGISIYDPTVSRYLYNYQGDKYFVPASNTKLFTCYAAMKYLGDSLVGLRYEKSTANYTMVEETGDPTFLHSDFKRQPVFDFLKQAERPSFSLSYSPFKDNPLGKGWAYDDYGEDYEPERSGMPIYGNVASFLMQSDTLAVVPSTFFNTNFQSNNEVLKKGAGAWFKIVRPFENNTFHPLYTNELYQAKKKFSAQQVPFKTVLNSDIRFQDRILIRMLEDTLRKRIEDFDYLHAHHNLKNIIHSQPTDSLLKPMMHRSDNFFAEQSLLMVSNEKLGYMSDEAIIDTLLKTDLKDLPQKPVWVDGSGLSRYNLFTPQDMVTVLLKIKNEFGLERIRNILPKGNTGTLTNYYQQIGPAIFAKTGSLSGQVALSGYLTCKSGKLLLFSIMINNYTNSGRAVRRAIEKFVLQVWQNN